MVNTTRCRPTYAECATILSGYSENMYLSEKDKAKQEFKYLKKNRTRGADTEPPMVIANASGKILGAGVIAV